MSFAGSIQHQYLDKLYFFIDILVNVRSTDPIYVSIIIRRYKTNKDNLSSFCLSKYSLIAIKAIKAEKCQSVFMVKLQKSVVYTVFAC